MPDGDEAVSRDGTFHLRSVFIQRSGSHELKRWQGRG